MADDRWLAQYLLPRRPTPPPMRIGHAEREQVAQDLKEHTHAGRLEMHEFEERVAQAYAAKTTDDLAAITADLPPLRRNDPRYRSTKRRWVHWAALGALSSWLSVSLLMVVIWGASGAGYFWPIWVIGPWGVAILPGVIGGLFGRGRGRRDRYSRPDRRDLRDRRRRSARY